VFKKLLIANRGEIALRVMRACKELGISTVAVHSEVDIDSLHVKLADESVCIGPSPASESYLRVTRILAAAEITGADAIHPGYGFLAENADFAEMCLEHNFVWVGPRPDFIRLMGNKVRAREVMGEAGVPLVPGSEGALPGLEQALSVAREVGYPVMIKAVGGGGGRGMRLVRSDAELSEVFPLARHEAEVSFGNPDLYLEKYLEEARHVEVQVLGDRKGSVIHMGERDCTIQRRHQKLIEEAPSPAVDDDLRDKLGQAALKGASYLGYDSVGTVEFLLDREGRFYFMEMNTRIQVEHPVTELVTGIDLVRAQIRRAAGERIPLRQEEIRMNGHAIECRINAEDPERDFSPCPGTVTYFHAPGGPGVRVDSHVYGGFVISPYYDSLVAKIICHGRTRDEAIIRTRRALEECIIEGVKSTLPFHLAVMNHPVFQSGDFSTRFLEQNRLLPRVAAVEGPAP
jgi:acetyl-CoA carboxylase biotin carboxylase subunit